MFSLSTDYSTDGLIKSCHQSDAEHFFFSERVVNRCNSLPQDVVDTGTVNAFKNSLDKLKKSKVSSWTYSPQNPRPKFGSLRYT